MAAVQQMQTSVQVHNWLPAATAALLLCHVVCDITPLCPPAGGAWPSVCGTWGGRILAACCFGAASRSLQASMGCLVATFTGGFSLTRAIGGWGRASSNACMPPKCSFLCSVTAACCPPPCADGSLGSRTALFHAPYADAADTSGTRTIETARLRELVAAADAAGLQASRGGAHAQQMPSGGTTG